MNEENSKYITLEQTWKHQLFGLDPLNMSPEYIHKLPSLLDITP